MKTKRRTASVVQGGMSLGIGSCVTWWVLIANAFSSGPWRKHEGKRCLNKAHPHSEAVLWRLKSASVYKTSLPHTVISVVDISQTLAREKYRFSLKRQCSQAYILGISWTHHNWLHSILSHIHLILEYDQSPERSRQYGNRDLSRDRVESLKENCEDAMGGIIDSGDQRGQQAAERGDTEISFVVWPLLRHWLEPALLRMYIALQKCLLFSLGIHRECQWTLYGGLWT